ncbi:MAG: RagB/SusD family nutrient uptake outer membrane protein [Chitinophagaceae bacterium]
MFLYKKGLLTLLAISCCTWSCKKFLHQDPYNRLSIDDVFKDFEGARTTLVGAYDNLKDANYYQSMFPLYTELTGGNIKYTRSTSQYLFTSYNFNNTNEVTTNDMAAFYQIAYNTVYRCNNVISFINNIKDASQLQKNRMLADAYTLRALSHFDLVRVFALPYNYTANASHTGIIYRKQNTDATVPVGDPVSVKEVYNNLTADLDSAISLYSNSVPIYAGGSATTWLSLDAAKAIQMRVSLYKEDWPRANTLASEIIAANSYPLVSNSSYVQSWKRKTTSNSMDQEAIFMLFSRIDQNQASYGDNFNPSNGIFGYMASSNDLLNLYYGADVRGANSMFVQKIVNGNNYFFTSKYQGMADTANNQKLIRISEIYLTRAEALAESNNLVPALADLNRIRKRANPVLTDLTLTDKQQVLDSIYVERRRELCFEGQGLFDITRKKKHLIRTDCQGSRCSISYPSPLFATPRPTQR